MPAYIWLFDFNINDCIYVWCANIYVYKMLMCVCVCIYIYIYIYIVHTCVYVFIRDVLLWTPTHGHAKAGRPARTYIQQLCEDTGCPEDLPRAMNDREEWRERVRDIRATSAIWWWLAYIVYVCMYVCIYIYIYIYIYIVLLSWLCIYNCVFVLV